MARQADSGGVGKKRLTTGEIRQRGASALGAPTRRELGKRLQSLRENAGYKTRSKFADAAGILLSTYRNYEYGMASMSYTTIWDVCKTLGITPNELLGYEVDPERENALLTPHINVASESPVELTKRAMSVDADEEDILAAIQALLNVAAKKKAGWLVVDETSAG